MPAPAITKLPYVPPAAHWVLPRRRWLSHARLVHVAHRSVEVTLCGRVRPGDETETLSEGWHLCQRCVYRAGVLWHHI
jgi:hypothetical protein